MIVYFKLILSVLCFFIYIFVCLFVNIIFIFISPAHRRRIVSRSSRLFALVLTRILRIKIKIHGLNHLISYEGKGIFLVSNHLSYIDGFILGSILPVIYVTKSELKKWPLIGFMTEISGTIFIDRRGKNHTLDYVDNISRILKEGCNILFFPEGTSTCGEGLLPFKSAFFEAPVLADAPIVPASIVYKAIDGKPVTKQNRDLVYWYGDMTFAGHFFRLLSCRNIEVEVKIHPPIVLTNNLGSDSTRKQASDSAYEVILQDIKSEV